MAAEDFAAAKTLKVLQDAIKEVGGTLAQLVADKGAAGACVRRRGGRIQAGRLRGRLFSAASQFEASAIGGDKVAALIVLRMDRASDHPPPSRASCCSLFRHLLSPPLSLSHVFTHARCSPPLSHPHPLFWHPSSLSPILPPPPVCLSVRSLLGGLRQGCGVEGRHRPHPRQPARQAGGGGAARARARAGLRRPRGRRRLRRWGARRLPRRRRGIGRVFGRRRVRPACRPWVSVRRRRRRPDR